VTRRELWVVGLFADGERVTLGPMAKATAEALFKTLNDAGLTPTIQPLRRSNRRAWARFLKEGE